MKKLFQFTLLLLLIGTFTVSCEDIKDPEFQKIENLRFKSVTLNGDLELTANAIFHNPNPVGVKITGLDLDVEIEDKEAAHISQELHSEMKANSDFSLPLKISIPIEKVARNLKETITSIFKKKKYKVELRGEIEADILGHKITVPMESVEETEIPLVKPL